MSIQTFDMSILFIDMSIVCVLVWIGKDIYCFSDVDMRFSDDCVRFRLIFTKPISAADVKLFRLNYKETILCLRKDQLR